MPIYITKALSITLIMEYFITDVMTFQNEPSFYSH